jgi:hypothetical protein
MEKERTEVLVRCVVLCAIRYTVAFECFVYAKPHSFGTNILAIVNTEFSAFAHKSIAFDFFAFIRGY